jgi:hypothetical protein
VAAGGRRRRACACACAPRTAHGAGSGLPVDANQNPPADTLAPKEITSAR